jgi:hypothetical protein
MTLGPCATEGVQPILVVDVEPSPLGLEPPRRRSGHGRGRDQGTRAVTGHRGAPAVLGADLPATSKSHGDIYKDQVGVRPTHTQGAKARRQDAKAQQRTTQREWEAAHRGELFDPSWFREHIHPGLCHLEPWCHRQADRNVDDSS